MGGIAQRNLRQHSCGSWPPRIQSERFERESDPLAATDAEGDDASQECPLLDLVYRRIRSASAREELQSLPHEGLMILENASVSGLLIEDEFGIRQAARQVDRVAVGVPRRRANRGGRVRCRQPNRESSRRTVPFRLFASG